MGTMDIESDEEIKYLSKTSTGGFASNIKFYSRCCSGIAIIPPLRGIHDGLKTGLVPTTKYDLNKDA